jgi:GTP-binding protein
MYFVDLPGYGYAKVSKTVRESLGEMIEGYLRNRAPLKLAVMLVDSRIPPTESDTIMKAWLDHHRIPNAVVLTKIDKLSRNEINRALHTGAQTLDTKELIAFSAVTGYGKNQILERIRAATE